MLCHFGHAGSLGQVLTDETVGVFVRSSFPAVVGRCEIESDPGRLLEARVVMELGATVGGDGAEATLMATDEFSGPLRELGAGSVFEFPDQNMSALALDDSDDAAVGT